MLRECIRKQMEPKPMDHWRVQCGRIVMILLGLFGVLFSLLAIYSCSFFETTLEQIHNTTSFHLGLFRYMAYDEDDEEWDTGLSLFSSSSCYSYGDSSMSGRLRFAQILSILAPVLAFAASAVAGWDMIMYPKVAATRSKLWHHWLIVVMFLLAAFFQLVSYASLQATTPCTGKGGYDEECTMSGGARIAALAILLYSVCLVWSLGMIWLDVRSKLQQSILTASIRKSRTAPLPGRDFEEDEADKAYEYEENQVHKGKDRAVFKELHHSPGAQADATLDTLMICVSSDESDSPFQAHAPPHSPSLARAPGQQQVYQVHDGLFLHDPFPCHTSLGEIEEIPRDDNLITYLEEPHIDLETDGYEKRNRSSLYANETSKWNLPIERSGIPVSRAQEEFPEVDLSFESILTDEYPHDEMPRNEIRLDELAANTDNDGFPEVLPNAPYSTMFPIEPTTTTSTTTTTASPEFVAREAFLQDGPQHVVHTSQNIVYSSMAPIFHDLNNSFEEGPSDESTF
eukprot:Nitzschia sp. Nitz4//scaffold373_size14178//3928//5653//NITZ4_008953-RA/size14178-snap-gene-0.37-mRNA-1//1//CDS//3329549604//6335//frame0